MKPSERLSDNNTLVKLDSVSCSLDSQSILNNISFTLSQGEVAGLLGPSGCGKTTTLRCIAGFERITEGKIWLAGQKVSSPQSTLEADKRGVGMIFQDYALFPHLTIQQNIGFGLERFRQSERTERIKHYLNLVGLNRERNKFPDELSGGQQQRVALARALAPHPKVLLMDEPFSSLDTDLRRKLSLQVRDILAQEKISAIMVTHDQVEAFSMCDRVGVIDQGRLIQWDTPYNLYHEPNNRFVANFIGKGTFLRGSVLNRDEMSTELGNITGNRSYNFPQKSPVDILIRPDDIVPDSSSPLKAQIIKKYFQGAHTLYALQLSTGSIFEAFFPSHHDHDLGEWVGIRLEADHLVAFPV